MDTVSYLAKVGLVLLIFYAMYGLLLKKLTFFKINRFFLLCGLCLSFSIPFIEITRTVYVDSFAWQVPITAALTQNETLSPSITLSDILLWLLLMGSLIMGVRLVARASGLAKILMGAQKTTEGPYVLTYPQIAMDPCSFFNYIIVPASSYSERETEMILTHEKVHADQKHSIDLLFLELATVFLWWNPIFWLFRKAAQENLEFLADQGTQKQFTENKTYQYLLVKSAHTEFSPAMTHSFFNPLIRLPLPAKWLNRLSLGGQIKKRIVMMNAKNSSKKQIWRYALVVPLLVAFMLSFNTKVVAQTNSGNKTVEYILEADASDSNITQLQKQILADGGLLKIKNIKRNTEGYISHMDFEYKGSRGGLTKSKFTDLSTILVFGEHQNGGVFVNHGKAEAQHSRQGASAANVFIWNSDDNETIEIRKTNGQPTYTVNGKDMDQKEFKAWGKKNKKDIRVHENVDSDDVFFFESVDANDNSVNVFQSATGKNSIKIKQTSDKNGFYFIHNDSGKDPIIVIDGEIQKDKSIEDIELYGIETVNVLKGESAKKKYGKKAVNGAIEITTKKE